MTLRVEMKVIKQSPPYYTEAHDNLQQPRRLTRAQDAISRTAWRAGDPQGHGPAAESLSCAFLRDAPQGDMVELAALEEGEGGAGMDPAQCDREVCRRADASMCTSRPPMVGS